MALIAASRAEGGLVFILMSLKSVTHLECYKASKSVKGIHCEYMVFYGCFKEVSRKLSRCFKKVSCCMALIAASRAEGGLVYIETLFAVIRIENV